MANEQFPKKSEIIKPFFELKKEFHASGKMQSIIGDFEWYLDLRKRGETGSGSSTNLWEVMSKRYGHFSNEEIETLIDQLRAD